MRNRGKNVCCNEKTFDTDKGGKFDTLQLEVVEDLLDHVD